MLTKEGVLCIQRNQLSWELFPFWSYLPYYVIPASNSGIGIWNEWNAMSGKIGSQLWILGWTIEGEIWELSPLCLVIVLELMICSCKIQAIDIYNLKHFTITTNFFFFFGLTPIYIAYFILDFRLPDTRYTVLYQFGIIDNSISNVVIWCTRSFQF